MGVSALSQQGSTGAADDDARLRDRLVFGDETAFADLYDRFSSLVYTIATRVTRDTRAAEDVTRGHREIPAARGTAPAGPGAERHARAR